MHAHHCRNTLALLAWVAFTFSATATSVFIAKHTWYAGLVKPTWNPPAWLFGPVWTALYIMMAVAAWLVWREGGWRVQRWPLGLYLAQWTLNALWTPLFFGLHRPGLAFAEILVLDLAVLATLMKRAACRQADGPGRDPSARPRPGDDGRALRHGLVEDRRGPRRRDRRPGGDALRPAQAPAQDLCFRKQSLRGLCAAHDQEDTGEAVGGGEAVIVPALYRGWPRLGLLRDTCGRSAPDAVFSGYAVRC